MNNQKKYNLFLLVLLLAAIFPFIALSFFNYPSADDLIYTHVAKNISLWSHIKTVYLTWSGRYFGTFIVAVNPLVFNCQTGFLVFPIILLTFFFGGIYFLIKPLINNNNAINSLTASLIIQLLIIQSLRSPVEAFYWLSGAFTYTLSLCMTMFLFVLIFNKNRSIIYLIISALLSFLIAGSNEIILLFSLEILVILLLYQIITKSISIKTIVSLSCMLAGGLILFSAPGNSNRMNEFPLHGDITSSLILSAAESVRITFYILKEPSIIVFIFVLFILSFKRILFIPIQFVSKKIIFLFPFIILLVLMSLYFPAYYAMGSAPPPRIHNTISTLFLLLLFFTIIIIGNFYHHRSEIAKTPDITVRLLIIISAIMLYVSFQKKPDKPIDFTGNISNAWNDLLFQAAPYQKEMNERLVQINESRQSNQDTIILSPIIHKPYTIFYLDITENPEHWLNISFREYYHLKFVKLQNKKP